MPMQSKQKPHKNLPLYAQRKAVIDAALPHVLFDGWSDETLNRAALECDIDPALLALLFPKGGLDAIAFHSRWADAVVVKALTEDASFAALPVPVKIRHAILKRFELAASHKEAVRKGLSQLSMPLNASLGLTLLHETCDSMWQLAGDEATDFNWYTKRFTLAGVYSATLLFWLNDESKNARDTAAFLDRRLNNVKAFGKWKAECQQWFGKLYGSA